MYNRLIKQVGKWRRFGTPDRRLFYKTVTIFKSIIETDRKVLPILNKNFPIINENFLARFNRTNRGLKSTLNLFFKLP